MKKHWSGSLVLWVADAVARRAGTRLAPSHAGRPAAMDASPAWVQAGCWVRITGLAKAPQHNGKVGKVSAKAAADGRVGVELGKGQTLSVRLQNLERAEKPAAGETSAAAAAAPPPRTGGSWDDVCERQLLLTLSDDELARRAALLSDGGRRTPLLTALSYGIQRKLLRVYGNPPRYDRLVVSATAADGGGGLPGAGSHSVEMEIDAYEGRGWWMTRDCTEAELSTASEGLQLVQAATLESEYAGALAFLEACKKLGAPRYVVKTELDPENALPHVLGVVERVLAASSLRFLLAEDALERADANPL